VLAHARALLTSSPAGKCAYIHADLREPEKILNDPVTRDTLDFTRPIGLILAAIVHFLLPEDDPAWIISKLVDALPSGSYVVASHGSTEYGSQEEADVVIGIIEAGGVRIAPRSSHDFGHLVFDGLELVAPGVVLLPQWRPAPGSGHQPGAREVGANAGVARKP